LGWIVGHAFGGDLLATVVCASLMPWIIAFVSHPGPHRGRRVAAVLVFSGLVASCRKAVATLRGVRTTGRGPTGGVTGEPAGAGVDAASATLTCVWLRHVTLTVAFFLVRAAAGRGSAALVSGSALLGTKVVAAKAVIALAVVTVAGGSYVAVEQLLSDRSPATPANVTSAARDQTQKAVQRTPGGGGGALPGKCLKPRVPPAAPCAGRTATPSDLDGDGIPNRQDTCPRKFARTPNGCAAGAPADLTSASALSKKANRDGDGVPADLDGDGIPNRQDNCPNQPANTSNGCPEDTPGDLTSAMRSRRRRS
jgi:hypothetical protein